MANEDTVCPACGLSAVDERPADSISALDREDVEAAIRVLRSALERGHVAKIARVATALAEHLIDRHDA